MEGNTYGPDGPVSSNGAMIAPETVNKNIVLNELLTICALCNDAKVVYDEVRLLVFMAFGVLIRSDFPGRNPTPM